MEDLSFAGVGIIGNFTGYWPTIEDTKPKCICQYPDQKKSRSAVARREGSRSVVDVEQTSLGGAPYEALPSKVNDGALPEQGTAHVGIRGLVTGTQRL